MPWQGMDWTTASVLPNFIILVLVPVLCTYACFSDMFSMRISNRVCLSILALFGAFAVLTGMPLATAGWHLLAGSIVLCVSFLLFASGWIGGGDAKLVAAISVWIGFSQLWEYIAISSVLGGFLTLALLSARSHPLPAFAVSQPWALRLHDKKSGIPYGIALGVTALIMWPQIALLSALL
jgi:prepilin peptidase CpaA